MKSYDIFLTKLERVTSNHFMLYFYMELINFMSENLTADLDMYYTLRADLVWKTNIYISRPK